MMLSTGAVVIHDGNAHEFIDPTVAGETKKCRTVPRDLLKYPLGCYPKIKPYHAVDMPLIDQGQWSAALAQQKADGRQCSDFRNRGAGGKAVPSRDQNGRGYCWQHSGVSAMLVCRARDNLQYADLSAYGPACREKQFRDEGGWGAQGVQNLIDWGCPTSKTWPQQGTSRSYDTPATWAEAAKYKVEEGWVDLAAAEYDRNLSWQQFVTCWLTGEPTVNDYNWWSHSVCGMNLVEGAAVFPQMRAASGKLVTLPEFDSVWDMADPVTAGFGCLIWNSWGDSWSNNGMGVLAPSKAVPDGGVALRTVSASAA